MTGKWVLDSDGYNVWRPFSVETKDDVIELLIHEENAREIKKGLMEWRDELKGKKDE